VSIKQLAESYRKRTGDYGHAPPERDWGLVGYWLLVILGLAAVVIGTAMTSNWSWAFVLIALVVCAWCWK
jgi:heme/copper-type cytochrome/quinol oxidase subunit 4